MVTSLCFLPALNMGLFHALISIISRGRQLFACPWKAACLFDSWQTLSTHLAVQCSPTRSTYFTVHRRGPQSLLFTHAIYIFYIYMSFQCSQTRSTYLIVHRLSPHIWLLNRAWSTDLAVHKHGRGPHIWLLTEMAHILDCSCTGAVRKFNCPKMWSTYLTVHRHGPHIWLFTEMAHIFECSQTWPTYLTVQRHGPHVWLFTDVAHTTDCSHVHRSSTRYYFITAYTDDSHLHTKISVSLSNIFLFGNLKRR